jgi:anti-sigma factor RsiW
VNCPMIDKHVGPYVDGELDVGTRIEFDEHFDTCEVCQERLAFEVASRDWMRESLQTEAPKTLRANILGALDAEEQEQLAEVVPFPMTGWSTAWRLVPAAAATALVIFGGTAWRSHQASADDAALQDVVRVHAASLPSDVAFDSADPEAGAEQVNEWFRGRVEFPVRAAEFESRDMRLVGARLSNVRERRAAALYYELSGQRVTVVVTDADVAGDDGEAIQVGSQQIRYGEVLGRRVPVRREAGLNYAFTGDVDRETLLQLAASARVR